MRRLYMECYHGNEFPPADCEFGGAGPSPKTAAPQLSRGRKSNEVVNPVTSAQRRRRGRGGGARREVRPHWLVLSCRKASLLEAEGGAPRARVRAPVLGPPTYKLPGVCPCSYAP
jgi:hypothetical protein